MRNILLFCISVIFTFQNSLSHAQTFHGIAPGSSWIHEWDNSSWGGETVFEEITIGADTIISAQTYHKVISNYDGTINYLGAVRNDTASNQVKIIPKDSVTDYKLYDYGVNIGDTVFNVYYIIYPSPEFGEITDFKIVDIDSFMINSEYYRRYSIQNLDLVSGNQAPDYWYEGFGSYDGVLGSDAFATVSDYKWLVCFNVNGTTYEHELLPPPKINESTSSCILNIVDIEEKESDIIIYPTPFKDELFISSNQKSQSIRYYDLKLYSLNGKLINSILRKQLKTELKINMSTLKPGVYFLHISSDNGTFYTKKIIKE